MIKISMQKCKEVGLSCREVVVILTSFGVFLT